MTRLADEAEKKIDDHLAKIDEAWDGVKPLTDTIRQLKAKLGKSMQANDALIGLLIRIGNWDTFNSLQRALVAEALSDVLRIMRDNEGGES